MRISTLLFLLIAATSFAQKKTITASGKTATSAPGVDSATYNFLSPVIKMIQAAEDPKKGQAFFMTELQSVTNEGVAVYRAPYSIGNFTATVFKTKTDRVAQTTSWKWVAVFTQSLDNLPDEKIELMDKKADSLLQLLNYKKENSSNTVGTIFSFFNKYTDQKVLELRLDFTKGLYNTEQQAIDSLLNVYKPLLFKPAFASGASEKLGYALEVEGINRNKITSIFKDIVNEMPFGNSEAIYQVMLGVPDFVDYKGIKDQLQIDKKNAVTAMAKKEVDQFYEEQRRKFNGDPVVVEQKKAQTLKVMQGCPEIEKNELYKYQLGITMISTVNGVPFIGRVTKIDCFTQKVTITKPGKRIRFDYPIDVSFNLYKSWEKNDKQFHRCTACAGEGGEVLSTSSTRTKELPFGYFSGIKTTSTRTTTSTKWYDCYKCDGTGWELK